MPRTIFKLVFLVGLIIFLVFFVVRARQIKGNTITDDRKAGVEGILSPLAFIGLNGLPFVYILTSWLDFANYELPAWLGWIGAVLFVASLWLAWRSHIDLGDNWSPALQMREGHALVTRGIYRSIRHPIYATMWLWAIAQALLLQNWIVGLAGLVSFLPIYLYRVPREERMMLDHFGAAYQTYMSQTGRVIPLLGKARMPEKTS